MSIYRSLPDRPSLEQLKTQAKELLRAIRGGNPAAVHRFQSSHPRAREVLASGPRLSDAQLVLAREYDFPSWPALHDYTVSGASVHKADLRAALQSTAREHVERLLAARPELVVARFAPHNDTPLHLAAAAGDAATGRLLIERGAILGALNSWRGTPLMTALIEGHAEVAELLIERGAGAPTLDEAAGIGNLQLMQGFWDEDGKLRPNAASRFGHELEPGVWESRSDAPLNEREVLHSALEYACRNGRVAAAKFMLERGASVHGRGFFGAQPLHWAAGRGKNETVRFLVEAGADLHARDPKFDATPYGWARFFGHSRAMALLCELGYRPNGEDGGANAGGED